MNPRLDYAICTQCIMDTSDKQIVFDDRGICNHCHRYKRESAKLLPTDSSNREEILAKTVAGIQKENRGQPYDCLLGVSGGVDSTFLALKAKELGLRPLIVHLDNGWNSEIANSNIECMIKKLNFDLYTYVIEWEEFRDLQVSFLRASVPDGEIPTDHAIGALLYRTARKFGVKTILSGNNVATEAVLPPSWSQGHADWRYVKSVHDRFGSVPLKSYPFVRYFGMAERGLLGIHSCELLNLISYNKAAVQKTISEELGWRDYGGKHYESVYTRFFQGYILPHKFKIDKRRAHLSNLICSGQITRHEALEALNKPIYPENLLKEDLIYVPKKLGLSPDEFEAIMKLPIKSMWDYPNTFNDPIFLTARALYQPIKRVRRWIQDKARPALA